MWNMLSRTMMKWNGKMKKTRPSKMLVVKSSEWYQILEDSLGLLTSSFWNFQYNLTICFSLTKNSEKFSVLNCKCIFVDILVRGAPTFRWEKAAPRLMRLPSAKPSWLKSSVVNLIQKFASLFISTVYFSRPQPGIDEQTWNKEGEVERRRNGLMEGGTSGAWTDFQGEQWESASKIMFIAGIEQHQHYGILCCQPWPGGDLLSRGGDQVLIWLYI